MKSVYEYDNYRKFLKDFYLSSKATNENFSLRFFSRLAGFKSHSVLRQVMEGQRNVAPRSIKKFAKALRLNKEESVFFENLVLLNQAETSEEKEEYAQALIRSRSYRKHHPLKNSQYRYFAFWYFIAIRELIGLPGFKEDFDWISKKLAPPVSASEVKKAIEELIELGLVVRDPHGKLVQKETDITTPDEVISSSFAKCHKELIKKASDSIDRVSRENRDISGVTFSMSKATMTKVKEKIHSFRKEIVELASNDQSPDTIFQLNLQLFPLTDVTGKETK